MRPGCCCARPRSLGSRLWKQWKRKRGSGRNPWQINCTKISTKDQRHILVEVKLTGKYGLTVRLVSLVTHSLQIFREKAMQWRIQETRKMLETYGTVLALKSAFSECAKRASDSYSRFSFGCLYYFVLSCSLYNE